MANYVGLPPGSVTQYAGPVAPTGWLVCDGSAVSRTVYSDLFAAIGTTYGTGDGSSTFNLPDGRGRSLYGQGSHTDVDTLGDNEGASLSARRPKHKHTINDPGHYHTIPAKQSGSGATAGLWSEGPSQFNTGSSTTGISVGPQTGNEPTDSAPYLVVRHIIKI